jgi:hypothetical protein
MVPMPASVAKTTARVIERAQSDPAFAEVLAALVDAPRGGVAEYRRAAARALNAQRLAEIREDFKATALVTADVQRLLGLGTPQAVHRLRSRGRVIGLAMGNATYFPAWQFIDGRIRPDLAELLESMHEFTSDVISIDRVMRLPHDDLDGQSIAEVLDDKRLRPAANNILNELGA